jgi:hypothetical protein
MAKIRNVGRVGARAALRELGAIDVVFRVFPEGDVIALFPTRKERAGTILSYQHLGQHGDASSALIKELRPAFPEEYASLLSELKDIGYRLHIRKK